MKLLIPNLIKKTFTGAWGLEIDGGCLNLAHLTKKRGIPFVSYSRQVLTQRIDTETIPAYLIPELRQIAKECQISSQRLAISIPGYLAIVRTLSLPSHKDEEIRQMVEIGIPQLIPYSESEVVVDYLNTGQDPEKEGYSRIIAIIVPNDIVTNYLSILKETGLEPIAVELAPIGLMHWFAANIKHKITSCLIISLGVGSADLAIIKDNNLIFFRGIEFGIANLAESISEEQGISYQEAMEKIFNNGDTSSPKASQSYITWQGQLIKEINSSLNLARKEINLVEPPGPLLLCGHGANLEFLSDFLSSQLGLTVQIKDKFFTQQLKPEFILASGLSLNLLQHGRKGVNLLPSQIKKIYRHQQLHKKVIIRTSLSIVIIILTLCICGVKLQYKESYSDWLDTQIRQVKPQVLQVQNRQKQIQIINQQVGTNRSILNILTELHRLIPRDISLGALFYEAGKAMTLRGQTDRLAQVINLVDNLETSSDFRKVELKYVTKTSISGKEVFIFEIFCPFKP